MAAEMLEKILSAENEAKEKLEIAEAEARTIIDSALKEAKEIVDKASFDAENDKKQRIDRCLENAEKMNLEGLKRAESVCEEMAERCKAKSEESTKLIIEKLFS